MHFFKYGSQAEVMAIVLPPRMQKSSQVKEGDEYEFFEAAPGVFLLASKTSLAQLSKGELVAKLAEKIFANSSLQANSTNQPAIGYSKTASAEAQKASEFKPATQVKYSPAVSSTAFPANSSGGQRAGSPAYSSISNSSGSASSSTGSFPKSGSVSWLGKVTAQGFLVVEDANSAEVSQQLETAVKRGEVVGVKGFDKKLYIAERSFYEATMQKIQQAKLPKQFSPQEAAEATKAAEPGCVAVLQIMKEAGEVLEKKRGSYQLVK